MVRGLEKPAIEHFMLKMPQGNEVYLCLLCLGKTEMGRRIREFHFYIGNILINIAFLELYFTVANVVPVKNV